MNYYNIDFNKLKIIHIGGTNGKGSTSNILNQIYLQSGYNVGLFTSPHLIKFNERIKINNNQISEQDLESLVEYFQEGFEKFKLTFFEATTAIGLKYFLDNNVDLVILEVGMGGKYDSTNIVNPKISVITGIGLDHTAFLGNSLLQIAKEKAGIIKKNVPILLNDRKSFIVKKIKNIAKKNNSRFYLANDEIKFTSKKNILSFKWFDYKLDNVSFNLEGSYQLENLKTALTVLKILKKRKIFDKVNENSIREGLKNIVVCGRMETISKNPKIIIDAAHNYQGISKVFKEISSNKKDYKKIHIITGYLKDKDFQKLARLTIDTFIEHGTINFVQPKIERALNIDQVYNYILDKSKNNSKLKIAINSNKITFSNSVEKGFKIALKNYSDGDLIFITGSHFILGDFLVFYKSNKK